MPSKVIRDFIYIDVDRLYSLYSQVFEGVAAQILTSKTKEGKNRANQKGAFLAGKETEDLVTEASQETSNKLLHDFLYNELEEGISGAILEPDGVTADNYEDILDKPFLVKIVGTAEILDYQRMIYDTVNFQRVGTNIAYVSNVREAQDAEVYLSQRVLELQGSINQLNSNDRKNRTELNNELRETRKRLQELQDREGLKLKFAVQMGFDFREDHLQSIADTLQFFNGDNFEVTILPAKGVEGVAFRGILDKQHLRVQPEYLRPLYSGFVAKAWTMVGEITKFPTPAEQTDGSLPVPLVSSETAGVNESVGEQPIGMRDAVRKVISGLSNMETAFNKSNRIEVRVRPLAIYREEILTLPEKAAVK